MNIFLSQNGQQYGPYTVDQIKEFYTQGKISLNDFLCHDGQNWVSVQESEWLTGTILQTQSASKITTSRQAHPRKKILRSNRHKQAVSTIQKKATSPARLIFVTIFLLVFIGGRVVWRKYSEAQRKEQVRIQEEQQRESFMNSIRTMEFPTPEIPYNPPLSFNQTHPVPTISQPIEEKFFEYEPIGMSVKIPRGWNENRDLWNQHSDWENWSYVLSISDKRNNPRNMLFISSLKDDDLEPTDMMSLLFDIRENTLKHEVNGKRIFRAKPTFSEKEGMAFHNVHEYATIKAREAHNGVGMRIIDDHTFWFFILVFPENKPYFHSVEYIGKIGNTTYRIERIASSEASKNQLLEIIESITISNKVNAIKGD